ncbi:Core-2/I-Branching enzyme [Jannaschia seosinensis]|uniref:Peptide O-xylosyltransferase n=1 Tax=Jannaschia seosinensis TaxID=313367 RepID=A0A0M7BC07_9RHOB|nr:beta-1,6-N-acetylglucosaminyltransferase [Jannaschia seosinensis]CUH39921.1 Core-2/I-Branching enzyme [Jannaschia seosinensis]
MTLGFAMLVHTDFDRAAEVARYFAGNDCPVAIHVDAKVPQKVFRAFRDDLSDQTRVRFCRRVRVEWGTWSLVRATQNAASLLLETFPEVRHVFLASGSCLPLRPVAELRAHLDAHPETDFIESVTTDHVPWTVEGLEAERFTLRFPFSWRRQRALFDGYVRLQRRLGLRRRTPEGVTPHLGSQWWCLTRRTLESILSGPDRARMDAYFSKVWIPDESYFQTLARHHSTKIESRSLTLAKFDVHGKPHIFYDDHAPLLARSDCFVARKIWPRANRLYATFLDDTRPASRRADPNPGKIDRVFSKANARRGEGRAGLYSQARFPGPHYSGIPTCARYNVFCGFDDLFDGFRPWLARRIGGRVHGHLYAPDRAEFADDATVMNGCLSDSASLRDHRPAQFLTNLLWSTRGERQSFLFGPRDRQDLTAFLARDPNATIAVISGAWAVPLHRSDLSFEAMMAEAARLQRAELDFLRLLRAPGTIARTHLWTLADFVVQPEANLDGVLDEVAPPEPRRMQALPPMRDMSALLEFLPRLRDAGIKLQVTGDFDASPGAVPRAREVRHVG